MNNNSYLNIKVLLLAAALLPNAGCNRSEDAQPAAATDSGGSAAAQGNAAEAPGDSLNAIESLVAPIALYPDPLLAEVLIAATYPAEIALAERRQESAAGGNATDGKHLDASVQRLTHLPPVMMMLHGHAQWTRALGDAFLAQPEELLNAIQALRQRALQSGYLKDSAAQKILKKAGSEATANRQNLASETGTGPAAPARETIYIQPAEAEKIQVPLYDAETVFSASLMPQPGAAAEGDAEGFYPSYYQASAEADDNGAAALAFSAGGAMDGLLTWGGIEWNSPAVHAIKHRFGNIPACGDLNDCWLRSEDNGYRYIDELSDNGARIGSESDAIPWRHDPRHRRGLSYTPQAATRLGDPLLPQLAGQRLSALLPPAGERGFNALDSARLADGEETEDFTAPAPESQDDAYSVLSGLADGKPGKDAEATRGKESRNKTKAAVQQAGVRTAAAQRTAGKPPVRQAPQPEIGRELAEQQQRREAALSGAFAAVDGNVGLIKLFSARGELRRGNKILPQSGTDASARIKQAPEAAD